jgi:hypothetical protein
MNKIDAELDLSSTGMTDQRRWSEGGRDDMELDRADDEPSLGGGPVYPLAAVDQEEVGYRSIEDQAIVEAARGRYQAATGGGR